MMLTPEQERAIRERVAAKYVRFEPGTWRRDAPEERDTAIADVRALFAALDAERAENRDLQLIAEHAVGRAQKYSAEIARLRAALGPYPRCGGKGEQPPLDCYCGRCQSTPCPDCGGTGEHPAGRK